LRANSEDGGPLTDNVVFSSVQRVLGFKRKAVSNARSRTGALRDDNLSLLRVTGGVFLTSISIYGVKSADSCKFQDTSCELFEE